MSPELITAIRERIVQSQSKEDIKSAVLALGHSEEIFEAAYTLALHDTKENIIGSSQAVATPQAELPSVGALLKKAFTFANSRFDLTIFLALPLLVALTAVEVGTRFPNNEIIGALSDAVNYLAIFIYFICYTVCVYIVAYAGTKKVSYSEGFAFLRRIFIPLLLTYLCVILLVWGGFVFFIIPAIILSTYLYFTPFVLVFEDNKKGLSAILSGRSLVVGRWWTVTLKMLGFMILALLPAVLLVGIYEGVVEAKKLNDWFMFGGDFALELFTAFTTVMSVHAVNHLYHELKRTKKVVIETKFLRMRYWALALLGIVSFALLVTVAILMPEKFKDMEKKYGATALVPDSTLEEQISGAQSTAESFYREHNQSYEGVCEVLSSTFTEQETVTCNDEQVEWAIAVTEGLDTWCSDKTTYAKRVKQPLNDRVRCIDK